MEFLLEMQNTGGIFYGFLYREAIISLSIFSGLLSREAKKKKKEKKKNYSFSMDFLFEMQ